MCGCKQKNTQPSPQIRVVEEVKPEQDKQEKIEQDGESKEDKSES